MMTSSNGNIFGVTVPLCGEFTGDRWIPLTKASNTELWCFFYLHLNKRLSKHSRRLWFETPSWSLRRHCNRTCDCPRDSKLNPYDLYDMVECVKQILYVASTKQDTTQLYAYKGYTVQNNQRSIHCCSFLWRFTTPLMPSGTSCLNRVQMEMAACQHLPEDWNANGDRGWSRYSVIT